MGRKSLADERREAILAAFERCIGRYGIDVPLEQVADEAGVQRSLIRHYLGNRDELVAQVMDRLATAYPQRVAAVLRPALERGKAGLLDLFFATEITPSEWDDVIRAVTSTAQGRYPEAKRQVAEAVDVLVGHLADELGQLYPDAPLSARREVAQGIISLAFASAEFAWLGMGAEACARGRACAGRLLDGLSRQF